MVTKRTLEKWRREALTSAAIAKEAGAQDAYSDRILLLTQELLDQHLLKGAKDGKS